MSSIRFSISGWGILIYCRCFIGVYKPLPWVVVELIFPSQSQMTRYSGYRHLNSP